MAVSVELVNPAASTQAAFDCKTIASMGLNAKVLTHTRCHMHDVTAAIECGVDGVRSTVVFLVHVLCLGEGKIERECVPSVCMQQRKST